MSERAVHLQEITRNLELWAPPALAESYDNPGLICGEPETEITSVLVSLDATPAVVEEAIDRRCQLVVSHHPILFRPVKKLSGNDYVTRALKLAIRHSVGLYAIHTNLDHVHTGVNARLSEVLGIQNPQILRPSKGRLQNLTYFVPHAYEEATLAAAFSAGAGEIGNYSNCSFSASGTGRFRPGPGSNPQTGQIGIDEFVEEKRVELIVPENRSAGVIRAISQAHPYETLAYFLHNLENSWQDNGAGMIGDLAIPMEADAFLEMVRRKLAAGGLRHSRILPGPISRVAVCGGAGSFLIPDAIRAGAQVLVTADLKYHEYFDADDRIVLVDAGHFETEQFTSALIQDKLSADFPNIAVLLSETRTNPVFYA